MPWQHAAQPQQPRSAAPVPVGESVRLGALQASWKRDRQVAQRRLWWRWVLWGAQRYALPTAAALSVCAGMWFAAKATMNWLDAPNLTTPELVKAPPARVPTAAASAQQPVEPVPTIAMVVPSGMTLKFEAGMTDPAIRTIRSTQSPVSSAALSDAAKISNPQLISENWLHSKEP